MFLQAPGRERIGPLPAPAPLGLCQVCFGRVKLRFEGAWINDEEQLPSPEIVSVLEVPLRKASRHLRHHVHRFKRRISSRKQKQIQVAVAKGRRNSAALAKMHLSSTGDPASCEMGKERLVRRAAYLSPWSQTLSDSVARGILIQPAIGFARYFNASRLSRYFVRTGDGNFRGELTFGLKPILQLMARLCPALQINLVRAISYLPDIMHPPRPGRLASRPR